MGLRVECYQSIKTSYASQTLRMELVAPVAPVSSLLAQSLSCLLPLSLSLSSLYMSPLPPPLSTLSPLSSPLTSPDPPLLAHSQSQYIGLRFAPASEVEAGLSFEREGTHGSVDSFLHARFPGLYKSRRYCHWKVQYETWQWAAIPSKKAASWRQVPNGWKRGFGGAKDKLRGRCLETSGMPETVESLLAEKVADLTMGDRLFSRAEPIQKQDLLSTINQLATEINKQAAESRPRVMAENSVLVQAYNAGEVSFDELKSGLKRKPSAVAASSLWNMVRSFLQRHGFGKQKVNTAGTYLEEDDPKMVSLTDLCQDLFLWHRWVRLYIYIAHSW